MGVGGGGMGGGGGEGAMKPKRDRDMLDSGDPSFTLIPPSRPAPPRPTITPKFKLM